MKYIETYITGFHKLNIKLDELTELGVSDENLDYYCESRHDDDNKSIYYVQYYIYKLNN